MAIDNSGFINSCNNCGTAGFNPAVTYAFVALTKMLTVTDASAFGAGDGLAVINVTATDTKGNVKKGQITAAAGNVVLDLSSGFLPQYGYNITATVVSNFRVIGDLSVYGVANPSGQLTGSLGNVAETVEGEDIATVEP